MKIFETHPYDEKNNIWFVDTATRLRGKFFEGDGFSYAQEEIDATGTEALLAYDLVYLKRLFKHAHNMSLAPSARAKYLTTWEVYRRKYKGLCKELEESGFDFQSVIDIDWKPFIDRIGTPDGYYC